jgi:hypothetical protein
VNRFSAFAQAHRGHIIDTLAGPEFSPDCLNLMATIVRNEHFRATANRFIGRIPEQPFRALVPAGDDSVDIGGEEGEVRRLNRGGH